MSDKGLNLMVSEYHIIWEALNHYEKYLENMAISSASDDEELKYDEKLQDVESARKSIKVSGFDRYGLELNKK